MILSPTREDTFSNPRRYSFLLKDAMILGKMFEGEGDNKKSKEKRLFCCHYQNIYVLLQKQKTRGHHQHRIIWERALPGLRCKDNNKNGIYQRSFRKITSGRICSYVGTRLLLHRDVSNATSGRNFCCIVGGFSIKSIEKH